MDPLLRVGLAIALFALTHVGLAWPPVRQRLVAHLGRWGFTLCFSLVAWITFGTVVSSYAAHAQEGPAGLGLGAHTAARFVLVAVIAAGSMLMAGAFAGYARSPYGIGSTPRVSRSEPQASEDQKGGSRSEPLASEDHRTYEPRGLERVTRHPFFVGLALLGGAHALLATRLIGTVLMGSLAVFALLGAFFQDRKLLALRGAPYAGYLAASSTLPFAAIAAGRQRLAASELPYGMLGLGLALAWLLRSVHAHLFDHGGAYVIAALVIGPLVILFGAWQRERRNRRLTSTVAVS